MTAFNDDVAHLEWSVKSSFVLCSSPFSTVGNPDNPDFLKTISVCVYACQWPSIARLMIHFANSLRSHFFLNSSDRVTL